MSYEQLLKGRYSAKGHVYLITAATHMRRPRFSRWNDGRVVIDELRQSDATTLAFVLMPDHLHWLMQLGDTSLPEVMRRLKGRTSRRLGGPLWQPGFHDHGVRDDEDLRAMARYLVLNPVRAGLAERIGDYALWDALWIEEEASG